MEVDDIGISGATKSSEISHEDDVSVEKIGSGLQDEVVSDSFQRFNSQNQILEDDELALFCVSKHDPRNICQVVKAMAFREQCMLRVTNEGIQVFVDDQHSQQGSAYFKSEQFTDYKCRVHTCLLRVPIKPFIEALNMLCGSMVYVQIRWYGDGLPLLVVLEDDTLAVQTEIRTIIADQIPDFNFNAGHLLCKAILNPQPISDIMRDLDETAETIVITFTSDYLQFYMMGALGRFKMEIPTKSEQLELLNCTLDRVQFRYRMGLFKRLKESIRLCNKLSLRIDERGILSTQMMVPQNEQNVFIEFYTVPENEHYYEHES